MRLTLRTLLAYLDDILEPADAKEIGAKIAESSYASSLVNKIKDVVRRRRIAAPDVVGPGAKPDPNIVAEYLDNTLTPESVADLERVCLESDMHLAEVAACHQVLTLVRSEPVEIPAGMRERMYALGSVSATDDTNGSGHVPKVKGIAAADVPRNTQPGSAETTLHDRLPEALLPKRKGAFRRALPYLIGVVVIGLWGYLIVNNDSLFNPFAKRSQPAVQNAETEVVLANNAQGTAGEQAQAVATPADEAVAEVTAIPPEAVAAPDLTMSPPATVEEGSSVAQTDQVVAVELSPEPDNAPAEQAVAAAPLAPELTPEADVFNPPAEQPEVKLPLPEPLPVQDASTSGILLHYDEAADDWFVLRPRSVIHPQDVVAVPRPFDATFTIGEGGKVAEVELRGGSRVMSLGSTDGGRFGFEIRQGQLVIRLKDTAPVDEAVPLQIVIRDDVYAVELVEPGTVMGIEVQPVLPTGEGDLRGATEYNGGMAVIEGKAVVTLGEFEPVPLQPAAGLLAFSPFPDAPPPHAEPLTSLPNWITLQGSSPTPILQRYAKMYSDEFDEGQPISRSIRPVVKDRRPPLSELATQTLALAGSYPGLVDALSSNHEESRVAAIFGLEAWLPLSPDHGGRLKLELQNRFRQPEADAIYRLLWGYSEADARDPITSENLVNWLGNDEIAIRELAFFHIHRLTDRRYDYRPNDPPAQRAAAIERWYRHVQEHGALLDK